MEKSLLQKVHEIMREEKLETTSEVRLLQSSAIQGGEKWRASEEECGDNGGDLFSYVYKMG